MKEYINKNLAKLKDELFSKGLYDILKAGLKIIALTVWTAFITSPFYLNFSFVKFLSKNSGTSIAQILSVVAISGSITWIVMFFYYKKRFVLIKKDLRTDDLTLLPNARALAEDLPQLISTARREDRQMSIIMMDIDDFKYFNSIHNQTIADEVLIKLGRILKSDTRSTDAIYRQHVKGDEFIVVALDTPLDKAVIAADRKRGFIAKTSISISGISSPIQITICCGVVELSPTDTNVTILNRAFDAMKMAKAKPGKNHIEILV